MPRKKIENGKPQQIVATDEEWEVLKKLLLQIRANAKQDSIILERDAYCIREYILIPKQNKNEQSN